MKYPFILFIFLILLQIFLDKYKCDNQQGKLLLWAHHIFSVYLIFGSFIFGYYKLHLLVILLSLMVHIIYKQCPVTVVNNKLCKQPIKKPMITFLNHLVAQFSGFKEYLNTIYHSLLVFIILYDVYNGFIR